MPALLFDTSRERAFVALADAGKTVFFSTFVHENRLAETLFDHIDAALKEVETLDYIAVGQGPGSYTGTRVGMASAKGISYGKKVPLIPFCSLIAYVPNQPGFFTCAMQARSGSYYVLRGDQNFDSLTYEKPEGLVEEIDVGTQLIGEKDPIYLETVLLYTHGRFLSGSLISEDIIYLYNYPTVSYTQLAPK